MNGNYILTAAILLSSYTVLAQNEVDALRYSFSNNAGTTRSLAMANAFGALGADHSSLHINPAGLGFYRKNEVSLGLGNEFNNVGTVHFGSSSDRNKYNFNLNNIGIALTYPSNKETSKWVSTHLGVSYGRTNTFAKNVSVNGFDPNSSLLMQFANDAAGTPPEFLNSSYPFTSSLAWETYTIDPLDTANFTYVAAFPEGQVQQNYELESSGRMSETTFAFGANYDHKLYLGLGISFVSSRYEERYVHTEMRGNPEDELLQMEYEQNLSTNGSGLNFRLGLIYRISDAFRVGGSITSPSYMVMNDTWQTSMRSKFDDGTSFESSSPNGEFSWGLNTPMEFTLSAASIIGSRGLISVDYEFTNMASAKMRRSNSSISDYDFAFENERIDQLYKSADELRVGTEWKIRRLVFRGGFNMRQNPIRSDHTEHNSPGFGYSGGLGYRVRAFSADIGFRRSETIQDRYLYDPQLTEPAKVTTTLNEVVIGFTYRY